jgi:SAM-dependent methyltransferase
MELVRILDKAQAVRYQFEKNLYSGSAVECPCCGSRFRAFRDYVNPNRVCWTCGARERHRALVLFFRDRPELFTPGMRLLHIAPEKPVALAIMRQAPGINYEGGDIEQRFGPLRIDITAMDFPKDTFDSVVANHVLEHVVEDRQAMSEVFRILKPGAWAVLMIPAIMADVTDEDATVVSPQERERRWQQKDHVRRYGWDYVERLRETGFGVEVYKTEDHVPDAEIERYRLSDPSGPVDSVFLVRKPGA